MKPYFNSFTLAVTLLLLPFGLLAQLRLPHIFSDHMVLQRNNQVKIWGWANADAKIAVVGSWQKDTLRTTTDSNGSWSLLIPTHDAGGPYTLSIQANQERIQLQDILLGDVLLCSGQSNMEWGGNQNLPEILAELPSANNPNIRLLQVSRMGTRYPQADIADSWTRLSAESLKPFSAIGYFLAKRLNEESNVPIGVINASWGGTAAEVWTPEHLIAHDPTLLNYAKVQQPNNYRPHETGVLWNGMLAPLAGYTIAGAYWYQGESNVGSWAGYDKLMKTMVTAWRNAWDADFPFYFVQIAPFQYNNSPEPKAALLREQQTKTALELPKTAMVVISDLVDNMQDIHPTQKKEVANRLANIALATQYNKNLQDYKSPLYKSQQIQGNSIEITFHHLQGKLQLKGSQVTDLFIAGADQKFYPAQGKIKEQKLHVTAAEVPHPVAVRFGFTEVAMPNLFNANGLPVGPFRTDNWSF